MYYVFKREGALKDMPEEKRRDIEVRLRTSWRELQSALEHVMDLADDAEILHKETLFGTERPQPATLRERLDA